MTEIEGSMPQRANCTNYNKDAAHREPAAQVGQLRALLVIVAARGCVLRLSQCAALKKGANKCAWH